MSKLTFKRDHDNIIITGTDDNGIPVDMLLTFSSPWATDLLMSHLTPKVEVVPTDDHYADIPDAVFNPVIDDEDDPLVDQFGKAGHALDALQYVLSGGKSERLRIQAEW